LGIEKMSTYERDAWDEFSSSGNDIQGQWLRCAKGHWTLDKEDAPAGDGGIKIAVIMESASAGQILWEGGKITGRSVGQISSGFVPPTKATLIPGWNPYIAFQCVRADDECLGDLLTFTASSWGGFYAFQTLTKPWLLKGRRQFPICVLSSKDRGDVNGNVDPVFKIVAWSARENFTDLLPPPTAPEAHSGSALPAPIAPDGVPEMIDSDGEIYPF
jgi:hypothetical protein